MARLEAQSKLLYYPTPNEVVDLIATWFRAEHKVRLADPCCGTGEALRRLADALGNQVETWGVELSNSRAAQAAQVLDHVLPTSFYALTPSKWSSASVSLIFNNPPYDFSDILERDEKGRERRIRHELLFVENATRKIVTGGHQVIIVPRSILGDEHLVSAVMRERFTRHVLGWYEQVKVMRFPDGEYERFKQVVVFAVNKRAQYLPAGKEAIEAICQMAHSEADIPTLTPGGGNFVIPAAPEKARFTYTPIEPAQLARAANQCSPVGFGEYQRATYVRPLGASFSPALPLSVGHVTMLITGQETGVLEVEQDGAPALVKGMSRKVAVRKERDNEDQKGKVISTSVTEKERHEATLTVARQNGDLEMLADMESVGKFITAHATRITDAILAKNHPLYDFHPTPREWEVTGKSALCLPPLPGRSERGLFPVQRHFAIGAARVMRKQGAAIMNCEMGFGKTSVSISSLELLDKWPAIIMVPGHMVWKWKRDVERSSNPEVPITARVITRPVLSEPGRWTVTKSALEAKGGTVTSFLRWQVDPLTTNDPGGRLRVEIACSTDKAGALAALFAQYTFKDEGRSFKPAIQLTQNGLSAEYVDRDEYTLFDFVKDYKAGRLGRKAAAIIAFDPAKYDAGAEERPAVQYHARRIFNEETKLWEYQRLACCPTCGHGYHPGSVPHFCSHEITDKVLVDGEVQEKTHECGTPLFQMSRWRRVGLARLVQHKFRHFFKVYVADECFPGDTPIATPHGNVPIKDICIGDEVLTEKNGEIVVRKVTRIIRNPKRGKLLKIVHTNGELICTPNHKIFINGEFVRAEMLNPGDELTFIEEKNDHQTMPDVRKHISNLQSQKADLPPDLRSQARSADAWGCGTLPHLRQGVHSNQDQERETENLQQELRRETARPDRNQCAEAATRPPQTAHPHELHPLRKRVHQLLPSKIQKVLLASVYFTRRRINEQGLGSGPRMAEKSFGAHEIQQPDGESRHHRKSRGQKAWAFFCWRSRREWSVDPTANQPGKCSGMGNGSSHPDQESFLAGTRCGHRQPGSENRHRSRWRFSSVQAAEKQGSEKSRAVNPAGLVADQILELGDRQRLGKVHIVSLEDVSSEEQYVYNLEVEETHRYFARGVLVSNCHKAQNGKTDVGVADQRLLSATRHSLALTGTLFGGTSSSLFYLLYRRVPEIRRLYAFSDVTRWVDHYGLWERQWDQSKPSEGGYGASTNIRRWNLRQRELPGIAPAVIRYLLPITLFGNITDLGYALPPINEVVETLEMPGRLAQQYEYIEREVLKEVMEMLDEYGDIGGLSAWFSACRFRPASAYRDERIDYSSDKGSEIHIELPAVTSNSLPWLPKETRLAEIVRENMALGRKTLVFVEQSGTRDIRGRLESALESLVTEEAHVVNGRPLWVACKPRVGILSASDMSPAKREAWIKLNAPQMDVLVVNPKLIETGLDLVQFSSLVFYETTVSLYVLWQAMRRVWRLGQDKEVNVTFLAYGNTVEEEILRRMGQKKKAAQLLYGKEAAGVLVETDSDDVQREMIQAAIEGRAFRSAGDLAQSLFSDGTEKKVLISPELAGSLVAASLPMIVLQREPAHDAVQMTMFGEVVPVGACARRKRR